MREIVEQAVVETIESGKLTSDLVWEKHRTIRSHWWGENWPGNLERQEAYGERYLFIKGSTPVFLTAPHAVPHDRGNYDGRNRLKPQDEFTDFIVLRVCQQTECFGLIPLTKLRDPNIDSFDGLKAAETPFLRCLEGLIAAHSIQLLLDIHGLDRERRGVDIEIGTRHGVSLRGRGEIAEELEWQLRSESDYLIRRDHAFVGGEIVGNVMERIPAIQLEIHRRLRDDGQSREMERLIKILVTFITTLPLEGGFTPSTR